MIGLCSIGFFFLTLTTGVYAVFGSFPKAYEEIHFPPWGLPWEHGSSAIGLDMFDLIYRKTFVLIHVGFYVCKFLIENYIHGALLILSGLGAFLSIHFYFPPYNEGVLVAGISLILAWRIIKGPPPEIILDETESGSLTHASLPPVPEEPKHSDLNAVYELCTLYLVALDEQFTPEEQELVDQHFGPGTSERFIQRLPMMNWTEQFSVLHDMVQRLSPTDRFALKSKGRAFFQSILAVDEITNMEKTRFDDLMRFLEESME